MTLEVLALFVRVLVEVLDHVAIGVLLEPLLGRSRHELGLKRRHGHLRDLAHLVLALVLQVRLLGLVHAVVAQHDLVLVE